MRGALWECYRLVAVQAGKVEHSGHSEKGGAMLAEGDVSGSATHRRWRQWQNSCCVANSGMHSCVCPRPRLRYIIHTAVWCVVQIALGAAPSLLRATWAAHQGEWCRGVDWSRYGLEQLATVAGCVGGLGLSVVCRLLAEDHSGWAGGGLVVVLYVPELSWHGPKLAMLSLIVRLCVA